MAGGAERRHHLDPDVSAVAGDQHPHRRLSVPLDVRRRIGQITSLRTWNASACAVAGLDAAQRHQRRERLRSEPVLVALGAEVLDRAARPCARRSSLGSVTKRFGWPRSPSYLGISYSSDRGGCGTCSTPARRPCGGPGARRGGGGRTPRRGRRARAQLVEEVLDLARRRTGSSSPGSAATSTVDRAGVGEEVGRARSRLVLALRRRPTARPSGRESRALGEQPQDGPAAADLDVVAVRADTEHLQWPPTERHASQRASSTSAAYCAGGSERRQPASPSSQRLPWTAPGAVDARARDDCGRRRCRRRSA